MIFLTVGTQLPFPRLLAMVAEVFPDAAGEVFAQTADPSYSGPIKSVPFLSREEFERRYASASLVIGHAGTGTILAARRHGKPLIVVPRRHHLGEHRNDHQYGTAVQLRALGEARVCETSEELAAALHDPPAASRALARPEKDRLIENLRRLIGQAIAGEPLELSRTR